MVFFLPLRQRSRDTVSLFMGAKLHTDVIIVGAGVLGVSLSYHLSAKGFRCAVLEREKLPACHASGKNAGMIRHLFRHEQLTDWTKRSVAAWPEEIRHNHFQQTGSLIVGRDTPSHHVELFEQRIFMSRKGNKETKIPAVACHADGLLDSSAYVNSLAAISKKNGTQYYFGETAQRIERRSSGWCVETFDGLKLHAPWVVNAAGAWASQLTHPSMGMHLKPFARYLFVVSGWPSDFMPESDIGFFWDERDHWYMRRWDDNTRLVSICDAIPAVPEDFVPTLESKERLSTHLLEAFPALASKLRVAQSWHCFRTYTEDQLPIWGEDPDFPGYFWLAAFGGYGMSTSFAASEDASRQISGEANFVLPDFSPNRFRPHGRVRPEIQVAE